MSLGSAASIVVGGIATIGGAFIWQGLWAAVATAGFVVFLIGLI
jgi:hypothetical protein